MEKLIVIPPPPLMQNSSTTFSPNLSQLPPEFTEISIRSRNEVIAYSILFILAATGNLTVFFSVCNQLAKLKWRITVLMLHLSIADLIVSFFLMPLEIFWRLTIQWMGGDLLCKGCQFFRAFGLYLSSNILICISLDRFIAILFPLRMVGATRRVKTMIGMAWLISGLSAAPQCVVFSVQAHPKYPSFKQCVSFGFFSSPSQEIAYNVFSVSAMYFIPLIATIFTYSSILWKISSKSSVLGGGYHRGGGSSSRKGLTSSLKRAHVLSPTTEGNSTSSKYSHPHHQNLLNPINYSNTNSTYSDSANLLARAKKRTLRMTFVIVIVFVFCWTPYAFITLWYSFDKEGAKKSLDPSLQDVLFMMAVANSCLNPIVYGSYTKKTAGSIFTFPFFCCRKNLNNKGNLNLMITKNNNVNFQIGRKISIENNCNKQTSSQLALTSVI